MSAYETFYQLHQQRLPFILANVWNAESARIAEQAGFKAIGTSSGAIASSLGYPDGEQIPFEELLYIVKRMKASTTVPLSVDLESGYTDDPIQLNRHIQKLLDLGIVGINLEDRQGEEIYLRKLNGIKNHLEKTNNQLFINARTDVFLQKLPSPLETTVRRARLYKEAGADGLFVTAIRDQELVSAIAGSTPLPLNVVASARPASTTALAGWGVKRISMAVLLYKATYKELEKLAGQIQMQQSTDSLIG